MTSKKRLALLAGISVADLKVLLDLGPENFKRWKLGQSERDRLTGAPQKKPRLIQEPKPLLRAFHKRLALLLGRIEKPDFVYSATKKRSYVDNALRHADGFRCVKVDIKNFYPSVKFAAVRRFFKHDLCCCDDIAHVLAMLCCVDGALATGSPVSPALSYFANSRLFAEIESLARERELVFTLYVDDMVFSGHAATRGFAEEVRRKLKHHGFIGHKITYYAPGAVKVITGVAVGPGGIDLPHGRRCRIRLTEEAFARASQESDRRLLGSALIGQYREAERIRPGIKANAARIQARMGEQGILPAVRRMRRPLNLKRSAQIFGELRERREKLRAGRAFGERMAIADPDASESAA